MLHFSVDSGIVGAYPLGSSDCDDLSGVILGTALLSACLYLAIMFIMDTPDGTMAACGRKEDSAAGCHL